jgi:hypothetical protein
LSALKATPTAWPFATWMLAPAAKPMAMHSRPFGLPIAQ